MWQSTRESARSLSQALSIGIVELKEMLHVTACLRQDRQEGGL